jgi:hypothetical protein
MERIHHSFCQCGFGLLCTCSALSLVVTGSVYLLLG